ncbi:MAG: GAF domain-containing protein, partial [Desulfobacterales bacterium]|nr:GAF domain-containing protein [Desulfobacterales bacterium]
MKKPDSNEARACIEELVHTLEAVDWDREGPDAGPGTDKTHLHRRFFDAVSLAHMKLSGLSRERGRAERINKALFRISNAVNTTRTLEELYKEIHRALADNMDTTNFFIALYNKESDMLSFPYFIDETLDIPVCVVKKTPVRDSNSLTSKVVKSGKPLFIRKNERRNLSEEDGEEPRGAAAEVWLGVPLTEGEEVIGVMVVQSYTDPELYDEKDVDILVSVSEQVAIAIRRKRAEEALQVEKAHIERLFEGVQEAIVIADADNVVLNVNPEFTRLFGYSKKEAAGRSLDDLIVPAGDMDEALAYNRRIGNGEKVAFDAWRKRKNGVRINTSVIAAPILVRPDELGQYTIYRDITEQKRANSVLRTLYDISRAVNSTRGLDDLFELIHGSLGAIMDAKNFFIALYDEKADLLTFPYYIDEKDEAEPIFNASEKNSLTTKVIFQNKALIFDEAEMRRMNESDEHEVMGAICKIWIGVPLSIKGKVIGAVALQSHTDPDLYT